MSLDYIALKPLRPCASLEKLEADPDALASDYASLARSLWPTARWDSDDHALVIEERHSFEINVSSASLHLSWRGSDDAFGSVERLATDLAQRGYVLVDVQTSELFIPGDSANRGYLDWYTEVCSSTDV